MTGFLVSGIQQIGVGVADLEQAFRWYRSSFGMDIPVFEDDGVALLMKAYTGGEPQARRALLALNLQGGGGLEIWQFDSRAPRAPEFEVRLGDLGIFCVRIKAADVRRAHPLFGEKGAKLLGTASADPAGDSTFFVQDPFGSIFQIVNGEGWFLRDHQPTGGVGGCLIGVSDLDRSLEVYCGILGYDRVIYDRTGTFADLACLPGGDRPFRRALLAHSRPRQGAFSPLLGPTRLELVQALDRRPRKIYEGRFWGDLGFMHVCFDVHGMDGLKRSCARAGFPFTVDSAAAFSMGQGAGRFAYIEDPDGTLIEFVETYRLAIIEKLRWRLDLRRRAPERPLPRWLLRCLAFKRRRA